MIHCVMTILLLLWLTGCTLHPKYDRPDVKTPIMWRFAEEGMENSLNDKWWELFNDPVLNMLVEQALEYNQDLRAAFDRVDAFAARLQVVRSQLFPQFNATGFIGRVETSLEATPLLPGMSRINNTYDLLLNASYQLDIWGEIRSATEAARADLFSQIQVSRTIILTLVAAVSDTYFRLRQFDEELQIADDTLRSREESYRLTTLRFELGLTSEMPVNQSKAELDFTASQRERIVKTIAELEDELSFLLGIPSQAIPRGRPLDDFLLVGPPVAGVPSEVLDQRPDILAAEQDLIAAGARIGVAKAQFFPSLSLTGLIGGESILFGDLFKPIARTWQYGLNILQEIFTGGQLTGNLKLTRALQSEALHNYQSIVLQALREVNDSLIDHQIALKQMKILTDRVEELGSYFHLATLRYDEGQVDYLNVLDAERQLFLSELDVTTAKGDSVTSLVDLYKALGGSWVMKAESIARQTNCQN